ncbi:hypothetical protein [Saprospira grandis]|uniref:hypothetical protein n=1 Tax=Saprospira grandis TaxID=1008 RepID=UPI0022DCF2E1|nr:hypothetical protein [Saprospira grandis]WBM74376.1 hypothetical protein OP864_15430 [Saprospira grandis]
MFRLLFALLLLPFKIFGKLFRWADWIMSEDEKSYAKTQKHKKNNRKRREKYREKRIRENNGEVGRR